MRATLLDLSVLHNDDLVCIADRAQPVSHDYDRLLPTADQLVQRLLHLMLRLGVQRGRCLVQEEQLRFTNEGTCDCYALLLAAGEFDATLAY